MWVGPLDRWLRALDTIEALEPEVVVPGHGPLTDVADSRRCAPTGPTWRSAPSAGCQPV